MKEKLVLFDVDGILIPHDAINYDYWHEDLKKNFGLEVTINDIYTDGKTDKEILKQLLEFKGIKIPASEKRFIKALNDVGLIARRVIGKKKIKKIPNVENLIKLLIKEDYTVGLLTGNTAEKTKAKLESCDLWKYFKIAAFGDASENRSDLVKIAMDDAKEKTGIEFKKENVFVIGDTVRDIWCAKKAGVKSISVATGLESFEMLKKENPDFIFKNFDENEMIVEAIKSN